ncbi:F-box/kelch-repeat protein At3g06240-like [Solanum pennellii]|uniref:F-box/kelch-repeat protein At3g06240-like n=2 Tax=Solanum subgen. Lycopersicon TaxID=49274 RepID=A0A075TYL7_SOLPN|nr:F-box/kelch-repeat protein At3g06240-like [Solanum pennellii]AIG62914.1 S-locus F-box protein type-9 [Solanum peruvianum]AIG62926.1 S-locus F-box protein type-9 [Solanum pennellii]
MMDRIMKVLPQDVVIYIFLMLPVKSLLRFKCTCKTFCNIINSSTFIHLHLHCSNDELILFKHSIKQEEDDLFKNILSFLSSEENCFDFKAVSPDFDVPEVTTTSACVFVQVIGPCNGLIAITDSFATILFNPTTRHYRSIPACPFGIPKRYRRSISGIGFGYDSIQNDYKFIRISEVYEDYMDKDMKVDIFDLSTDCWRELNGQQVPLVFWTSCSEILYNNACHWFASTDDTIILCFEMNTEEFYHLQLPESCHWYDGKSDGLIIVNNCLSYIRYPDPLSDRPAEVLIDIWIMKEYNKRESWIKRCSIGPITIDTPLAVLKGDLLLLQTKNGDVIGYDLNSHEIRDLNLYGYPRSWRVVIYKESLTPIPREGDTILVKKF